MAFIIKLLIFLTLSTVLVRLFRIGCPRKMKIYLLNVDLKQTDLFLRRFSTIFTILIHSWSLNGQSFFFFYNIFFISTYTFVSSNRNRILTAHPIFKKIICIKVSLYEWNSFIYKCREIAVFFVEILWLVVPFFIDGVKFKHI